MSTRSLLLAPVVIALVGAALLPACDDAEQPPPTADRPRLDAPLRPAASCPVTIETPPLLPETHISEGTPVTYNSNPAASGPHYATWANFQEFSKPIDDRYLIHTLEHGAVALLYKCEAAAPGCAATIDALRKIRDGMPTDPLCDPSIRVRVVIAPSPTLDVPVAAVAWGITYKAECVDVPTLTQFAKDNYARARENLCPAGRTF